MSEFNELVKNFEKVRNYIRDFYIYGFKIRGEYDSKSPRTYDNEKRRIENWLNDYIQWDYSAKGKNVFISVDSSKLKQNPLYESWKCKSFTPNDIMLHFFIADILEGKKFMDVNKVTNEICERHQILFEPQTVRNKLNEYEGLGIIESEKIGKTKYYRMGSCDLNQLDFCEKVLDAVKFFSETAPFGFVGNTILDNYGQVNDIFRFKHYFIVHTLEDSVLLKAVEAIKEKRAIKIIYASRKSKKVENTEGIPIKILVSAQSGRRYLCLYKTKKRNLVNIRLDYIENIKKGDLAENYDEVKKVSEEILQHSWGVSLGNSLNMDYLSMTLYINEENEIYILNRLEREKRGGNITRVEKNKYCYTTVVYDTNEMLTWVKTFTGRIIKLEGSSKWVIDKFYNDMRRMADMYGGQRC